MNDNFQAALEIGTSRTVIAVSERGTDGRIRVTRHGHLASSGVRKSQIFRIDDATRSISAVLRDLERNTGNERTRLAVGNAVLAVSGPHILAEHIEGVTAVTGRNAFGATTIGEAEIEAVRQQLSDPPIPTGRTLLDIVEQDFRIDDGNGTLSPKDMAGRILKLNGLGIHADTNRLQDARTAAEAAKLEIRDIVFSVTCAAEAVLEEHEKKNGTLLIDFGGGSTGFAIYLDGYPVHAETIGVGGDHITNDIAYAFRLPNPNAEELKVKEARATLGPYAADDMRIPLTGVGGMREAQSIPRRALDAIVNARVKETLDIIREKLESLDLLFRLQSGVVITGGGADLHGLETLIGQTLGLAVRKGRPLHVDGFENEPSPWSYATIAGALQCAHNRFESAPLFDFTSLKGSFLNLFRRAAR